MRGKKAHYSTHVHVMGDLFPEGGGGFGSIWQWEKVKDYLSNYCNSNCEPKKQGPQGSSDWTPLKFVEKKKKGLLWKCQPQSSSFPVCSLYDGKLGSHEVDGLTQSWVTARTVHLLKALPAEQKAFTEPGPSSSPSPLSFLSPIPHFGRETLPDKG